MENSAPGDEGAIAGAALAQFNCVQLVRAKKQQAL
jgi:hypothetical protein